MDDKRKFSRFGGETTKAVVSCAGIKENATILDVSVGGMRVFLSRSVELGALIHGEFKIFSNKAPFFIKGKVTRVKKMKRNWEVATTFDKVSTIPLQA